MSFKFFSEKVFADRVGNEVEKHVPGLVTIYFI